MIVALYQDHHELPFWGGKTNPFDIFAPEKHKSFPFPIRSSNEVSLLGKEKPLFSFLSGLQNVEASHLMAHVSAFCGCQLKEKGWWHYPKRVWVQISTLPSEFTENGIPVVYDIIGNRKPEISAVWGGDNGTHFPSYFFLDEKMQDMAANDSKIWTRFFVEQLDLDPKLKSAKDNFRLAEKQLKDAKKEVDRFQIFSKGKLNLELNESFNVC